MRDTEWSMTLHASETKPYVGMLAFRAPKQGLESGFRCWIAGQGLAQKECVFVTDTGMSALCLTLRPDRVLRSRRGRLPGAPKPPTSRGIWKMFYDYYHKSQHDHYH